MDKTLEKNRAKRYRDKLRKEAIRKYGGKCICCGEKNIEFLTIDHKGGNGSKERKKISTIKNIIHYLKKHNYPPQFQLLCFNCNWASRLGKICPHKR